MRHKFELIAPTLCLLLLPFAAARAQDPDEPRRATAADEVERPVLRAVPVRGTIELDGRLTEPAWQRAPVATGFTQRRPDPGEPASRTTEVRVLYGEEAIYVGARMYDDPDSIAAQLTRRDDFSYSDVFIVGFDSYNDNRTAFLFGSNPLGVEFDARLVEGSGTETSWDAVWAVENRIDSLGWTAEFRIPLSQLRYSPETSSWGLEFQRVIARTNERLLWAPIPPDAGRFVALFGTLTGIADLPTPTRLEIAPYVVSRLTRPPSDQLEGPFRSATEFSGTVGADFQYGLSSAFTLTGTVNPDFGQVEADPSQVNLTAFETFFPEQRPFFIEGSDIFEFDLGGRAGELFYSRRIGAPPHAFAPEGAAFSDVPERTTILGAVKLSGKTAGGWEIGVLDAVTAQEEAVYRTEQGIEERAPVEPLTNYAVARVVKNFGDGESALGAVFTATNRRLEDGGRLSFLRSAAYTGGIDGRHRFGDGNYEIEGYLIGSHIRGSERAITLAQLQPGHFFQRPDAEHLDFDPDLNALSGWSANLDLDKIGGGNWRWGISAHARSPGFEVDDLGFQRRADRFGQSAGIRYIQNEPGEVFRRWNLRIGESVEWTFGGERVDAGVNTGAFFRFQNFWFIHGGVFHGFQTLSTSRLRGGPAIIDPASTRFGGGVHSDDREALSGALDINGSLEHGTDGWSFRLSPSLSWRPSARLQLSLSPRISWSHEATQYVTEREADGRPRYIFAGLDRTTIALTARASYTFRPGLTLEFYGQPFISAGDYLQFREVADPLADQFVDRFRPVSLDLDRDFNFKQFRSNAVLRWEWRPGSTLFLVWNSEFTGARFGPASNGSFELFRDVGRLFDAPGANVFLIKASYWLSL